MSRLGALVREDFDLIHHLRAITPKRALTWSEVHAVAERQAHELLSQMHIYEPPVPQLVITSVPGVFVDWRKDWPTSGMSVRARQHWRIVLRASEPRQRQRQRFTLAHEFKHVLDDPLADRLFRHLPKDERAPWAERLCDSFAACLLMPRGWVKRDWYAGQQDVAGLAQRYFVSEEAMTTRLRELGLAGLLRSTETQTSAGRSRR